MPAENRRYNPFELVGVVLIVLLAFAAFFISFLLAPLAVLGLFYFILAATDRARGEGSGNGHGERRDRAETEELRPRRASLPANGDSSNGTDART